MMRGMVLAAWQHVLIRLTTGRTVWPPYLQLLPSDCPHRPHLLLLAFVCLYGVQALKLDEDVAREEAVLSCLHSALQYAVSGAVAHRSIQCVVLCVFTLHCCRGRGSAEQKQQRQAWHTQLSDALPAGDKAKWAAVGWVDPRLESHATQVRRAVCLGWWCCLL